MILSSQYLAGLFDGEGCVSAVFDGEFTKFTVSIAQKNPEILLYIITQFPGGTLDSFKSGGKFCHRTLHRGLKAKELLEYIKDDVIIKKKQVDLALKFCSLIDSFRKGSTRLDPNIVEERNKIVNEIRELNQLYRKM